MFKNILNNFFTKSQPPLIGVDISSSAVKMLQLSQHDGHYRVENYGVLPLPASAVEESNIKDPKVVSQVISDIIKKKNIACTHAAIAVPDSLVIKKIIQLDANFTSSELEAQVMIEAERYISKPLEEISLDFEVLGASSKNPNLVDVLLVASHKVNVDKRIDALQAAGLEVKVVDVESCALERSCQLMVERLPNKGMNAAIAVIDIGSVMTGLTVLYNMATIFSRTEVFGGSQLTEEIQRHYGMSYAEAGLAKKTGALPEGYATEVLKPFMESLVLHIRRALQFFFSASQYSEIKQIILTGGVAALPGLGEFISGQLGIPVLISNPFIDMTIAAKVDQEALKKDASALLICCGLAMRNFIQSPPEVTKAKKQEEPAIA